MRPIEGAAITAVGPGQWIPVDFVQASFILSLAGILDSGAALTFKGQYTYDDLRNRKPCSITRAATTATLVLSNHGLAVGDTVVVNGAGAPFDGYFDVATVTDVNTITYTVPNSGQTTANGTAAATTLRVFDHATLTGKTARADGSILFPVTAVRLNCTAYTSGRLIPLVLQGAT